MGYLRRGSIGALVLLALAGGGCGGSDDPSEERIARERKEAAAQAVQKEKIRRLEQELQRKGAGSRGKRTGSQQSPNPSTPAPAAPPAASSGSTSCGNDLSVGLNTSCPFAEEVRASYPGSSASFQVYSPTTGRTYSMSCTTGSPHACRGGNGASVYFP